MTVPDAQLDRRRLRRALIALCITETVSWGVLYYSFPVAVGSITADTGWSATTATAAFSMGLVVSAIVGIPVGRLLQRRGPRVVMTTGSTVAVGTTVLIAEAPTLPLFFAAWALAGVLAVVTVPAHAFALSPPWRAGPAGARAAASAGRAAPARSVRDTVRSSRFLILSAALTVTSFGMFAASLTLIPLLTGRGMGSSAAAVTLGLVGAGQLLGRLLYAPLSRRVSTHRRTVVILAGSAVTVALLAVVPGPPGLLIVLTMLMGAVRGAVTLLQATLVADRWGTGNSAALSGWFSAPITVATAVAPWVGTALGVATGSFPIAFGILAGLIADHGDGRADRRPSASGQ